MPRQVILYILTRMPYKMKIRGYQKIAWEEFKMAVYVCSVCGV